MDYSPLQLSSIQVLCKKKIKKKMKRKKKKTDWRRKDVVNLLPFEQKIDWSMMDESTGEFNTQKESRSPGMVSRSTGFPSYG